MGRIPRSAEHPTEPRAAPASRLTKNNYLVYHISSAQVECLSSKNEFEAFVINTMNPGGDVTELLDFH